MKKIITILLLSVAFCAQSKECDKAIIYESENYKASEVINIDGKRYEVRYVKKYYRCIGSKQIIEEYCVDTIPKKRAEKFKL
jgi:hypothetical protein